MGSVPYYSYYFASNLDQHTAEHFAQTVNRLKGKVTILFITHQLPKGLQVDEAVLLGKETEREVQKPLHNKGKAMFSIVIIKSAWQGGV